MVVGRMISVAQLTVRRRLTSAHKPRLSPSPIPLTSRLRANSTGRRYTPSFNTPAAALYGAAPGARYNGPRRSAHPALLSPARRGERPRRASSRRRCPAAISAGVSRTVNVEVRQRETGTAAQHPCN